MAKIDWAETLRALRSRNYRLFFTGQTVSLIGTWMTRIATSWLVYRLTDSALLLGLTGFAGQIPAFFLAPIAGVWLDRWDKHRTLVATQVLAMLQSLALAYLAFTGIINIWWITFLVLAQGTINAFDMPARQSFVIEMIERRADLSNAIALNSSMVNGTRLIGPAIAGMVIAAVGEAWCFLIDGISYIAVIVSLLAMRIERNATQRPKKRVWDEMVEGWRYVTGSPAIRSILLVLALVSIVGMPYTVLVPIMAGNVLHGGAHTMGFLMGMSGVGALASAFSLALRKTVIGLGRMIWISAAAFGVGLIVFGLSRWVWLSMLMMIATGFGMMQQMAASNTILQTIVQDDKRGRVMSFYTFAILGVTPIGSLFAGALASRFGAPTTLVLGGICCAAGALWFYRKLPEIRRIVRPIYIELGIIPEVAEGIRSAAALQTPPEG
ncbi:MAG: MFS transporter [Bryobacterales bacterium]|nr:MFS transporter [Bryobacterales bacterium]MBV9396987.1 MFS transporter [Bryobacterales bacterium]